jgi:hypothetical protein
MMSTGFVGGVELAQMAKSCGLIPKATMSLTDLVATILHHRLDKDLDVRVSNQWEEDTIPDRHLLYAAKDAYASLSLYNHLCSIPTPSSISPSTSIGTAVTLHHNDGTKVAIARGHLMAVGQDSPHADVICGVKVTKTRCVIEIGEVLVPGALVPLHKKPLNNFGTPPFKLVAAYSSLKTNPSSSLTLSTTTGSEVIDDVEMTGDIGGEAIMEDADELELEDELEVGAGMEDNNYIGTGILADDEGWDHEDEVSLETFQSDIESQRLGTHIIETTNQTATPSIPSRVLKDPFHAFNMIRVSKQHGLSRQFARAMSAAMFIDNEDDRACVTARLEKEGSSYATALKYQKTSIRKLVRRHIPPPIKLYPLLSELFRIYGPLKDLKTDTPLFNTSAWASAKSVLQLVKCGYLSDPPGVSLYVQTGVDRAKGGLPVYRCLRGTNTNEGGIHEKLTRFIPRAGAGVRHAEARLCDFQLKLNLLVCATHAFLPFNINT